MKTTRRTKLNWLWQILASILTPPKEPQIHQFHDRSGAPHWIAVHPISHESISTDSEKALRIWIEQFYYF